ncbi:hypothetical protein BC833DRAFT_646550 [Globomyces pollinis-pini]|nr:hypothetical protein BC833DRAFT_646550 [Globomyces pollinis-pini]
MSPTQVKSPTKASPVVGKAKSPVLGASKSPVLAASKSPVLATAKSPVLATAKSPVIKNAAGKELSTKLNELPNKAKVLSKIVKDMDPKLVKLRTAINAQVLNKGLVNEIKKLGSRPIARVAKHVVHKGISLKPVAGGVSKKKTQARKDVSKVLNQEILKMASLRPSQVREKIIASQSKILVNTEIVKKAVIDEIKKRAQKKKTPKSPTKSPKSPTKVPSVPAKEKAVPVKAVAKSKVSKATKPAKETTSKRVTRSASKA